MKAKFIGNKVKKWILTKTLEQEFADETSFSFGGKEIKVSTSYRFSDKVNKICTVGIEWQMIIQGLLEYNNDFQFEVNYSDFTNDKKEAEKMIVQSLALYAAYLSVTARIRNALDLIPTFDKQKITDLRDRIIARLKKE